MGQNRFVGLSCGEADVVDQEKDGREADAGESTMLEDGFSASG